MRGLIDKLKKAREERSYGNTLDFDMITTKGGDDGKTSTYSQERVYKHHPTMELVGEIDTLSSYIGMIRPPYIEDDRLIDYIDKYLQDDLNWIQKHLIWMMGMIASKPNSPQYKKLEEEQRVITDNTVMKLEARMHRTQKDFEIDVPQSFIYPHSFINIARTYTRTVERRLVSFITSKENPSGRRDLIPSQNYINRLSDYLFYLALIDGDYQYSTHRDY